METKLTRVKRRWRLAKSLAMIGVSIWLIETVFFLIVYGWHKEAINKAEQTCDKIAIILLYAAYGLFILVVAEIVELILSEQNS